MFTFRKNFHISYFLYHLKNRQKINFDFFPKYIKRVANMNKKPKKVTSKFLYCLSLKYPLKEWSVLNDNCCKEWLIMNNLYEKRYKPKNIDLQNPKKSILMEIKSKNSFVVESKNSLKD